ncbi:MAG: hypothetical protein KDA24_10610 [Deltaproteobacteria bacterium]|nr:hypothetical protein [Deltaproteobacteria bacterium]
MSAARFLACLSLVLLGGCSEEPESTPASPEPTEAGAPAPPKTATSSYGDAAVPHMKHHFADACAIHDAVVRGDLGAGREAAGRLASHEPLADVPEFAPALLSTIQEAAGTVTTVESLGLASIAARKVGVACGDCHERSGAKLAFKDVPKPSEADLSLPGHMARHAWAVNRMWEGLVAHDAALWTRGLNELAEAPLPPETFGPKPPAAVAAASEKVHELGAAGLTAKDQSERGTIYGQLLAACSQCHDALGRGPGEGVYTGEK